MKILYMVEPRLTIGGGIRATFNLCNSIAKHNKSVELAVFGVYTGAGLPDLNSAVKLFTTDICKSFSFRYIVGFNKVIKKVRPDIIHVMGLYTLLLAVFVRLFSSHKYKIIVTVHRVTNKMRMLFLLKKICKYLSKQSDYATFLTDYQRKHYDSIVKFSPKKCCIIPNVIPEKKIPAEESTQLRESLLQQTSSETLAVYIGRIIESKQIEMFIQTIRKLRDRKVDIGGVIVGGGEEDYVSDLKERVKTENLSERVIFSGYVKNPDVYLACSDVVLFPTQHGEALPNMIIESFFQNKPLVVSSIPQLGSIVSDNVNSLVVNTHDPDCYADAVESILSDDELRKKISIGASESYQKRFSPDAVTNMYMEVYDKVMA